MSNIKYRRGETALRLAAQGLRIFPLTPNAKTPAKMNWQELATTDFKTITQWWDMRDYNIGVACGNGFFVIDYDNKPGQTGFKTLHRHEILGFDANAMRVKTPNGVHLYFQTTRDIRNSQGKIAKHVDVRGVGGYVVGPGSHIGPHDYVIEHEGPPGPAPLELETAALQANTRPNGMLANGTALIPLDMQQSVDSAVFYLENEAPMAIEGAGGDHATFTVAARVKDFGVTEDTCLELMSRYWNLSKAFPLWTHDDLAQKVANAYAYGSNPIGAASALAEFGGEPVQTLPESSISPTPDSNPRLFHVKFETAKERALIYQGDPLIRGLLNRGALSVLYGPSGCGKTFVALDIAFAIATGQPWGALKTTPGLAIYVAAEGGAGIFKRAAALHIEHEDKNQTASLSNVPFYIIPCPIDLLRGAGPGSDTHELIQEIQRIEKLANQPVALVVIDTLSRALAGGDESSSVDMGVFIKHVEHIRTSCKTHLCVIHHSGKDAARGARGWSGIRAAIDTELEIQGGVIRVTKQRDIDEISPVGFSLRTVTVGTDESGELVTSCVVDKGAAAEFEIELTPREESVLAPILALAETMRVGPEAQTVELTRTQIVEAVQAVLPSLNPETIGRRLSDLESKDRISAGGKKGIWVFNLGATIA